MEQPVKIEPLYSNEAQSERIWAIALALLASKKGNLTEAVKAAVEQYEALRVALAGASQAGLECGRAPGKDAPIMDTRGEEYLASRDIIMDGNLLADETVVLRVERRYRPPARSPNTVLRIR